MSGALHRCACYLHGTMAWVSQGVQEISGYPVIEFIDSSPLDVSKYRPFPMTAIGFSFGQ